MFKELERIGKNWKGCPLDPPKVLRNLGTFAFLLKVFDDRSWGQARCDFKCCCYFGISITILQPS